MKEPIKSNFFPASAWSEPNMLFKMNWSQRKMQQIYLDIWKYVPGILNLVSLSLFILLPYSEDICKHLYGSVESGWEIHL